MIRSEQIVPTKPNGIAVLPVEVRTAIAGLPAMVQRAADMWAGATTAAETLDAIRAADFAYDAGKAAARFAKAKGAHDELIATVYRQQANALEIEAQAKRKLADEYDAAQDRGEVAKLGTNQTQVGVSDGNTLATAADLGISRKDIHEARAFRDAENADPGIVRRVLDEKLGAGEEPTKAAVRKAVKSAVSKPANPKTTEKDMEPPAVASHRPAAAGRSKMMIPEGQDIVDICRRGIVLELDGATADEAAKAVGLATTSYSFARKIVLLADNESLTAQDAATARRALDVLVSTHQYSAAWEIVDALAIRVWGKGKKEDLPGVAARRLEQFELTFGIIIQSCMTTNEVDLPYLSAEQAKKAMRQIALARGALSRFAKRIKDIHG